MKNGKKDGGDVNLCLFFTNYHRFIKHYWWRNSIPNNCFYIRWTTFSLKLVVLI